MAKTSAGLLLFRETSGGLEVLLVHPGGPFWAKKDDGAWSIPKGELDEGEDPLAAARREFEEETGLATPEELNAAGDAIPLGSVRQPAGKAVHAWALELDLDTSGFRSDRPSNLFSMEWPPRSGKRQEFPEVDRVEWFPLEIARRKILEGQAKLLDLLEEL